jgi:protein TonB
MIARISNNNFILSAQKHAVSVVSSLLVNAVLIAVFARISTGAPAQSIKPISIELQASSTVSQVRYPLLPRQPVTEPAPLNAPREHLSLAASARGKRAFESKGSKLGAPSRCPQEISPAFQQASGADVSTTPAVRTISETPSQIAASSVQTIQPMQQGAGQGSPNLSRSVSSSDAATRPAGSGEHGDTRQAAFVSTAPVSQPVRPAIPVNNAASEHENHPQPRGESRLARIVSQVKPNYPEAARRDGIEGVVSLEIHVNSSGKAERVETLQSSGDARLDAAAKTAVMKWLFSPKIENGEPVSDGVVRAKVVFKLDNDSDE